MVSKRSSAREGTTALRHILPYLVTFSAGLEALQPFAWNGHWGEITYLTVVPGSRTRGLRQGSPAQTHPVTQWAARPWQLDNSNSKEENCLFQSLLKNYHVIVLFSSIIPRPFECRAQMFAYMNSQSLWHSLSWLPPRLNAFWVLTKASPRMSFWNSGDLGEAQEKGNRLETHKINSAFL